MLILSTCSDEELQKMLIEEDLSEGAVYCIYEEINNRNTLQALKEGERPGGKD